MLRVVASRWPNPTEIAAEVLEGQLVTRTDSGMPGSSDMAKDDTDVYFMKFKRELINGGNKVSLPGKPM